MFRSLVVALSLVLVSGAPLAAQEHRTGALILAHGGSSEWNAQILDLARQTRQGALVEVSFLDGDAMKQYRIQEAAQRLVDQGASEIVMIPLLVSSHSWFFDGFRYLAGEVDTLPDILRDHYRRAGVERPDVEVPIRLGQGLDDAPELARILTDRARKLADEPASQAVYLLAHGPDDHAVEAQARWMENLRRVAEQVRALGPFRDVRVGLVPATRGSKAIRAERVRAARELIELQYAATGKPVIVVPVLMSEGFFSRETIPADLEGLPIRYSGEVLLPHAELSAWVRSQLVPATPKR